MKWQAVLLSNLYVDDLKDEAFDTILEPFRQGI
jgi:hypothetical protein